MALAEHRWSYADMVNWDEATAKMFVLLGKFNQQVCNGGLEQYSENGYDKLHNELLYLFKQNGMDQIVHGSTVLKIMEDFKLAMDDTADAKYPLSMFRGLAGDEEDAEAADELVAILDALDVRYYAVYEEFCKEVEKVADHWVNATGK